MNRSTYLALYNRLNSTRTRHVECAKITREDGTVFRFTAHDKDLKIEEDDSRFYTYKSADSFKITAIENQSGLVVSNMDIDAIISDDSITDEDLISGLFDFANIEIFLAYWSGSSIGRLPLRTSWIGEIQVKGVEFKADLRGIAQKLQQVFVSTTSLECRWTFADAKCGLNRATFTRTVPVTSVVSQDQFFANIAVPDRNKFQWGLVTWLTGNNAGGQMEIIRNYEQRIQLFLPMPFEIETGDSVSLVYGCDKTLKTCNTVYANADRFGGEPFLAGSDLLMTYPRSVSNDDEEDNGGGSKF